MRRTPLILLFALQAEGCGGQQAFATRFLGTRSGSSTTTGSRSSTGSSSRHRIDTSASRLRWHRSAQGHHRPERQFPLARAVSRTRPARAMSAAAADGTRLVWPPGDQLSDYVTESYLVDYRKLAAEEKRWLAGAIKLVKETDPRTMDPADRHAFLINAYNLWTLHWVIRERRSPFWKGHVSTLAKARFFYWHKVQTGRGKRNLFNFENKDIRPEVNDARVHFALNCASMSCPPLRRKLFTGAGLDAELDKITSAAINGGAFVQRSGEGSLLVNPIFKWYQEDFDKEGGTLAFIKKHWKGTPLPDTTKIDFFEYDWRSNTVGATWSGRPLGGPAP